MWIKLNTKLLALSFILFSCFISAEENPKDPYEGFNRGVYTFHDTFDGAILKHLATSYTYLSPDVATKGLNHFTNNINDRMILAIEWTKIERLTIQALRFLQHQG